MKLSFTTIVDVDPPGTQIHVSTCIDPGSGNIRSQHFHLPSDNTFARIQEHTNNALRTLCNHLEPHIQEARRPQHGKEANATTDTNTNSND